MMWWNHNGWGFGDWLAMSLMMFAFWGLLVGLLVWLIRGLRNEPTPSSDGQRPATERAQEVLAERFARGEIDDDEFTHRRTLLQTTGGLPRPAGGK